MRILQIIAAASLACLPLCTARGQVVEGIEGVVLKVSKDHAHPTGQWKSLAFPDESEERHVSAEAVNIEFLTQYTEFVNELNVRHSAHDDFNRNTSSLVRAKFTLTAGFSEHTGKVKGKYSTGPGKEGTPPDWSATGESINISVDLDIDSNNNNRYKSPEYDDAEDEIEENDPGKIIFNNVDSDGGGVDRDDDVINGEEDKKDMAPMRLVIDPINALSDKYEAVLIVADKNIVRVFRASGEVLVGPNTEKNKIVLDKDWFDSNGKLDMLVEGVKKTNGSRIISALVQEKENANPVAWDTLKVTITDTLAMGLPHPFDFEKAYVDQHKDTQMICVKCPLVHPHGAIHHVWDKDHKGYLDLCKHCKKYCGRACIKMLNKYYGGNLSQDRISYEMHKDKDDSDPLGPGQLGHNAGGGSAENLAWSLNLKLADIENKWWFKKVDDDARWKFISNAVILHQPVIISWFPQGTPDPLHASIICGVRIRSGNREVHLFDPSGGISWKYFSEVNKWTGIMDAMQIKTERLKSIKPRSDETTVSRHSDSDGVVDFDEKNRFKPLKLHFKKLDTDGDGEDDKTEIKKYYNVK
ncbi:MAG: hypothetical protein JXB23_18885 [Candidatus Aminicenantes bacterium]|nr:hypothetical protein [Candidatus Aminicenantes bacterium]